MAEVTAAEYNAIYNTARAVMGVGSGTQGYGQPMLSSLVQAGLSITSTQWDNLRSDLSRARVHQTNFTIYTNSTAASTVNPYDTLFDVTPTTVVSTAILTQYQNFTNLGVNPNRLTCAAAQRTAPSGWPSTSGALTSQTRSGSWGNATNLPASLSHTITVTFGGYTKSSATETITVSAADHMRCFFNAGGRIHIRSSRSGAAATSKDTEWSAMIGDASTANSGFGDLIIDHSTTSITGSLRGTGSTGFSIPASTGWNTMSSNSGSPTTFLTQGGTSQYSENRYIVTGYKTSNQIIFTITWQDNDVGDQTGLGPAVDEAVTGTLHSYCYATVPSGANVSFESQLPTASSTGIA